jgi:hypothetical protein
MKEPNEVARVIQNGEVPTLALRRVEELGEVPRVSHRIVEVVGRVVALGGDGSRLPLGHRLQLVPPALRPSKP